MDSGYIIGDLVPSMLRFQEDGTFYVGEGKGKFYFYDYDFGPFSWHITKNLGWGSHYRSMPIVAWNYILYGNELRKLIEDYNATVKGNDIDPVSGRPHPFSHRMFRNAIDKIDDGLWYLLWEDYS